MKVAKSIASAIVQSASSPGHPVRTALWPVVLAFAFFFAQSVSYQHSYLHAGLSTSHVAGLSNPAKSQPARGSFLCFFHDALATVVATAAGKAPTLLPPELTACELSMWQFAVRVARAPTPTSRGPPLLL
jgi:hypothetical protein